MGARRTRGAVLTARAKTRARLLVTLLIGALLIGVLAVGCVSTVPGRGAIAANTSSGGKKLGTRSAPSVQPTAPTAPSESASTAGGTPETPTAAVPESADLGPDAAGFVQFRTPSGNIMCGLIDGTDFGAARCDIAEWTFEPPPAGECGQLNFSAGSAEVDAEGPAYLGLCAGDTVSDPTSPVLEYGRTAGMGRFGCVSAENGVTCINHATGHGFRISRASYDLF